VLLTVRLSILSLVLTSLASCEQASSQGLDVGEAELADETAEIEPAIHSIESIAQSLTEDVNSGQFEQPRFGVLHNVPLLANGRHARIVQASASGNRVTLEVSNPVGGISRSLVRSNTRIERWQRSSLCSIDAFASFIAIGGELEVDLQSRAGLTLHIVTIRDCT